MALGRVVELCANLPTNNTHFSIEFGILLNLMLDSFDKNGKIFPILGVALEITHLLITNTGLGDYIIVC